MTSFLNKYIKYKKYTQKQRKFLNITTAHNVKKNQNKKKTQFIVQQY